MDNRVIPNGINLAPAQMGTNHSGASTTHFTGALPIYFAVLELHHLGLNVVPVRYGLKQSAGRWKRLQHTRLRREDLHLVFAGLCNVAVLCGRTSGNLFVFDCETPEAFAYHLDQAQKRDIPLLAVRSTRGGHLWFFSADDEVKNIKPDLILHVEVRGCSGYVLCPPSRHPSGVDYRWLIAPGSQKPQTIPLSRIDWLIDQDGNPVHLKASRSGRKRQPSEHAQQAERIADRLHLKDDLRMFQLSHKSLGSVDISA